MSAAHAPPIDAPPHRASPPKMNSPKMLTGVSATTASGRTTAGTYGPPLAQAPPMPITARIESHRTVSEKASPASPTR